jgi:DNA-binding response OmpR family regulator
MRKVLLAEDDITMVSLLKTLLTLEGFEVLVADAEADIPALAGELNPDVLLLDVHLGHQNGMDILKSLRGQQATRRLHVIMSSGMNVKDDCMQHGASAFLLKPYMPDELIATLRKVTAAS